MLVYTFHVPGAGCMVWGRLIHADTRVCRHGTDAGFYGVLTTFGNVPWELGVGKNGWKGTFSLVCPD